MKKQNLLLIAPALLLSAISAVTIWSLAQTNQTRSNLILANIIFAGIGILLFFAVAKLKKSTFFAAVNQVYLLAVGLLILVLLIGRPIAGAQRWFDFGSFSLQPSEFGKLALILLLARYLAKHKDEGQAKLVLGSLPYVLPIAALVAIQPDLGSAVIYFLIWGVMLVASGLTARSAAYMLAAVFIIGLVSLPRLADYQKARVETFLEPLSDPRGSGYNSRQALIAIGNGGLWGQGLWSGDQSRLKFLPTPQTDFIFAVTVEKLGFVGGALVLLSEGMLIVLILKRAGPGDQYEQLVVVGAASLFAAHSLINIGMNLAVLPVVGLPLPFMSYGGSHTIANWLLLGIVATVRPSRPLANIG